MQRWPQSQFKFLSKAGGTHFYTQKVTKYDIPYRGVTVYVFLSNRSVRDFRFGMTLYQTGGY